MAIQMSVVLQPVRDQWAPRHSLCSILKRMQNRSKNQRSVVKSLLYSSVLPRTHLLFLTLNGATTFLTRLLPILAKQSHRHRKRRAHLQWASTT